MKTTLRRSYLTPSSSPLLLGGSEELSRCKQNALFGFNAGLNNTSGGGNSFFGSGAGQTNTTGSNDSFFGRGAGFFNTTGDLNSFFGARGLNGPNSILDIGGHLTMSRFPHLL